MNIRVTDPWTTIPTAAFWCGVGGVVSGAVFNKLSHLVEYTLNKRFGDYNQPKALIRDYDLRNSQTEEKIIVSMGDKRGIYYAQNAVLAALVITVASLVFRILLNRGCAGVVAWPLLVGSVAAPILLIAYNLGDVSGRPTNKRWVMLSQAEVKRHGIQNRQWACLVDAGGYTYLAWGSAPVWTLSRPLSS